MRKTLENHEKPIVSPWFRRLQMVVSTHHSLLGVAQQERAAQQSLLAQLLPGRPGEKVGSWDGEEMLFWDISLGTYKKLYIENHNF